MITEFAKNIWTLEGSRVKMFGIPFGTRMTVVKLPHDQLWIHSPIKPNKQMFDEVMSLGAVGHIVAPNKLHHLFVKSWSEHFQSAKIWVEPELAKRNLDFKFNEVLGEEPCSQWSSDMDQVLFKGSSVLPEVVFCHKPSKTLIVTDIIQNHDPKEESFFWNFVKRLNGILAPEGGCPRDWRLTVRDHRAARSSLNKILEWDFDKLILSHGLCIHKNAHAFVERAFSWL